MTASSRTQQARIDPLPSGAAQLNHIATDCLSVSRPIESVARLGDGVHGLRLPQTCYGMLMFSYILCFTFSQSVSYTLQLTHDRYNVKVLSHYNVLDKVRLTSSLHHHLYADDTQIYLSLFIYRQKIPIFLWKF